MTAIPEPKNTISALIDQHHEQRADKPRAHMGCSQLGHPCDRWLWLSFRWAVRPKFPGRVLRLFRRGHREEETIIADLRAIGIDIRSETEDGKQAHVSFGCHVSGSLDGIIESGVPEATKKRHIAEFKTHSLKSFADVEKHGVEKSKPEHYVQMQVYMHGSGIDRALYVAVCKDNDAIYTERVRYVQEVALKYISRGQRLALEERLPPPLSTDPSWHQCKYCAAYDFCHQSRMTQQVNCRTCAHVTPLEDSTWHCARHDAGGIPTDYQRDGCECHVLHPDLVPWRMLDSPTPWQAVYEIDGVQVRNGEGDAYCFASKELVANLPACMAIASGKDEVLREVRSTFSATITG